MYIYICIYVSIYLYVYIYIYIEREIYIYIHTYTYIIIYIYIHSCVLYMHICLCTIFYWYTAHRTVSISHVENRTWFLAVVLCILPLWSVVGKVLIHHIEAHLTTEAVAIKGDACGGGFIKSGTK